MNDRELSEFLERIRGDVNRTLAQLPAHQRYVEQYCGRPDRR
jgi:tryptophan halogenase